MTEKEKKIDTFNYKTKVHTRFADYDMFGHINNAVYFTYLEIARSKYWQEVIDWDWSSTAIVIARAELDYILPILLNEEIDIYVKTSRIGSTSFDLEYVIVKTDGKEEVICSTGKTVCIAVDLKAKKPTPIPEDSLQKMKNFEKL